MNLFFIILICVFMLIYIICDSLNLKKKKKKDEIPSVFLAIVISICVSIPSSIYGMKYIMYMENKSVKNMDNQFHYSYSDNILPFETYSTLHVDNKNPQKKYYLLDFGSGYAYNYAHTPFSINNNEVKTIVYTNDNTAKIDVYMRTFNTKLAKIFNWNEYRYIVFVPKDSITNNYSFSKEGGVHDVLVYHYIINGDTIKK